jgi:hypothetical protein
MRPFTWIARTALVGTLVGGAVAVTGTPASAFCTSDMTTWKSPTVSRGMGLDPSFPTGMRWGLEHGTKQWIRSESVLRYDTPSYQDGWLLFKFRGEHAYSSIMGTAPGYAQRLVISGTTHDQGDLYLSDRYEWINGSQNITGGVADTATVAVHEMGHFTGLAHPIPGPCTDGTDYTAAEQFAVMTTVNTGTRRFLTTDDIAGVRSLY